MSNQELSQEKKDILADNSRVIWVSACPGSGKTKLFVERALNEIEHNIATQERRGIAALSFTNLATEEIAKRLEGKGISADFPNFIGTIDSFIQHFILQPFASAFRYCHKSGMILIPEERVNALPGLPVRGIKFTGGKAPGINEYSFIYKNDIPAYTYKFNDRNDFFTKEHKPIEYTAVAEAKSMYWLTHGQLNHSDVKCLAAKMLKEYGDEIARLLNFRFTTILVDECQDLGRLVQYIFLVIAKKSSIQCFFVGDFDQNLYEQSKYSFPKKLSEKCLVQEFTLAENYRCPQKHCDFALMFMESQKPMISKSEISGRILLLVHNLEKDYSPLYSNRTIANFINDSPRRTTAILSHKNKTLNMLSLSYERKCIFASVLLNELDKALCYFERGNVRDAYALMQKIIRKLLISAVPEDRQEILNLKADRDFLEYFSLGLPQWKKISFDLLARISIKRDENWKEWRLRSIEVFSLVFDEYFPSFNIHWNQKFQIKVKKGGSIDSIRERCAIATSLPVYVPILTVHKAKGLEFDNVIYFFPKPAHDPCPILELLNNGEFGTWQKACFVGTTRARENLVICLHKSVVDTLRQQKPSFFDLFDEQIELK